MKKKTSKQKRVLVVSVLLAALIVAGSTFAWFQSQDEVTNKLSASNDFGVTITETFTPPSQWLPGEKVDKKVGVVNTGNIDAFVKLSLTNALGLTVVGEADTVFTAANSDNYIKLSKAEVTSLQAGGMLVCKAGTAITDEKDMTVGTEYTPTDSGLYIFRRSVVQKEDGTDTYEYAGYYYVKGATEAENVYYAIEPTSASAAKYPKTKTLANLVPELDYSKVAAEKWVIATYKGADNTAGTADDIVIYINLDSTKLSDWTLDSAKGVFYYNKILQAGKESGNLVTSVELSKDVQSDAYVDFDYYLTVSTDSVQVVGKTDDEKATAVNAAWTEKTATVSGTDVTWADAP